MTKQDLITSITQNIDALKLDEINEIIRDETYNTSYSFDADSSDLLAELDKISLIESSKENGKIENLSYFALHELNTALTGLITRTPTFISAPGNATHAQNYFNNLKTTVTAIDKYGFEFLSNSRMPAFGQREKQLQEIEDLLLAIKSKYEEENLSEKLEKLETLIENIDTINDIELDELLQSVADFTIKKTDIDELHTDIATVRTGLDEYKEEIEDNIGKNETNTNEYLAQLQELVNEKTASLDSDRVEYTNDKNALMDDLKQLQEEAEKTLKWATSASLSSSFQQKVKRIRWEFWGYFVGFIGFSSMMFIFGYLMFFAPQLLSDLLSKYFEVKIVHSNSTIDPTLLFLFKSMTMIPFILIVLFFWNSYKKSKELFEEYDYKTILAQSLMTHFTYLKNNSVLSDDEIKEHTIFVSLKRLLENPVELVYNRTKDDKNFFEKNKDALEKMMEEVIKKVNS